MKSRQLFLMCVAFIVFIAANAQTYEFKVLATKGKNEVKAGTSWSSLKVGTSLNKTDEIRLGANSYLGLINVNGKAVELKEPKTYKISELSAKIGTGPSVLNKYTDFIISSNTQKKNNLTATGAVHRGVNSIRVFLPKPESAFAYGDSITIQWEKEKAGAPYIVTLTTFFDDELLKTETSSNSITINLADPKFATENEFQFHVYSKKDKKESEKYTIRKVKKDERARVKPLLTEFVNQTKENTAINTLLQAGFLEKEKLFIDAATAFQKAVKLEPSLQEQYDEFLIRNGMNEVKKK